MKIINLSQALKQKNRLAGEIARLRDIVQRENSHNEKTPVRADVHATFDSLVAKSRELALLKGAISIANAGASDIAQGIYVKLHLQAELRGLIKFVEGLPTKEGEDSGRLGFLRDERVVTVLAAEIKRDEIDTLRAKFQREIESLQDAIDAFNSEARLEFAD